MRYRVYDISSFTCKPQVILLLVFDPVKEKLSPKCKNLISIKVLIQVHAHTQTFMQKKQAYSAPSLLNSYHSSSPHFRSPAIPPLVAPISGRRDVYMAPEIGGILVNPTEEWSACVGCTFVFLGCGHERNGGPLLGYGAGES
jgi:hypothetical protein